MKTKQFISIFIFHCLGLIACRETPMVKPPQKTSSDTNILFPQANPLNIPVTADRFNFPVFTIRNMPQERIYIGVFKAPIQVSDAQIVNLNDLVWHWNSRWQKGKQDIVRYEDGKWLPDTGSDNSTSLACLLQNNPRQIYYWAAWGWNSTGRYIAWATPENQFSLANTQVGTQYKTFNLSQKEEDQIVMPGESITLEVTLENTGLTDNDEVMASFRHETIQELPQTVSFGNLKAKDRVTKEITFTVPENLKYRDTLYIPIEISDKDCYTSKDYLKIGINGRRVCLNQIKLNKFPVHPKGDDTWDGCLTFPIIFPSGPDIFYIIKDATDNNKVMRTGHIILNASWDDTYWEVTPCLDNLHIEHTYVIEFWDDDTECGWGNKPDFMEKVSFMPAKLYPDFPSKLKIYTRETEVTLDLLWE